MPSKRRFPMATCLIAVLALGRAVAAETARHGVDVTSDPLPLTWILVGGGQDTHAGIRIRNTHGRTLTAYYEIVPGTAREEDGDYQLDDNVPVTLGPDKFWDVGITVFAEPLPHGNFHETLEILARVAAYTSWSPADCVEERLAQHNLNRLGYRV